MLKNMIFMSFLISTTLFSSDALAIASVKQTLKRLHNWANQMNRRITTSTELSAKKAKVPQGQPKAAQTEAAQSDLRKLTVKDIKMDTDDTLELVDRNLKLLNDQLDSGANISVLQSGNRFLSQILGNMEVLATYNLNYDMESLILRWWRTVRRFEEKMVLIEEKMALTERLSPSVAGQVRQEFKDVITSSFRTNQNSHFLHACFDIFDNQIDLNFNNFFKNALGGVQEAAKTASRSKELISIMQRDPYVRGKAMFHAAKYENAIQSFDDVIKLEPLNFEAYFSRGMAKSYLGRQIEAIADFSEAIKLNPKYSHAYYNRGVIYLDFGRYSEALADFNQVIKINPKYISAYYNRGRVHLHLEQYVEAVDDFSKAIQLDPRNTRAVVYYSRGTARLHLGEYEAAIDDFDTVIRSNPEHARSYHNRGVARHMLGQREEATIDFNEARRWGYVGDSGG